MIEESIELNQKTKKEIEEARKQIKTGKVFSHEEVKRKLEMPSFNGINKLLKKTRGFAKQRGLKERDVEEARKDDNKT